MSRRLPNQNKYCNIVFGQVQCLIDQSDEKVMSNRKQVEDAKEVANPVSKSWVGMRVMMPSWVLSWLPSMLSREDTAIIVTEADRWSRPKPEDGTAHSLEYVPTWGDGLLGVLPQLHSSLPQNAC